MILFTCVSESCFGPRCDPDARVKIFITEREMDELHGRQKKKKIQDSQFFLYLPISDWLLGEQPSAQCH